MPARRLISAHARGRERTVWPRFFRTVGAALAVLAVSAASLTVYAAWHLEQQVKHNAVSLGPETVPQIGALDGSFNVLLAGADNAPDQKTFGAAREGTRNDVNILVHVSADHRSGVVISLPRDLVAPQPACTDPSTGEVSPAVSDEPLNVAYSRGELSCVVASVKALTGLDIPYAALFTFEGTVKMADAVGGVAVCVNKAIDDSDSGLKLKKGVSVISGRTALAYLRDRHGVGDGSDLGRIASQQAYMSSLLRKMTSANTLSDPTKLYGLASAAASNIKLSQSLAELDTMVQMALALKSLNLSHMVFVQYPNQIDPADTAKVIPNTALASELMSRVQKDASIGLDKNSLGVSTQLQKGQTTKTTTPSPHASASSTPTDVIHGLKGQTAAQQTCSVANEDN